MSIKIAVHTVLTIRSNLRQDQSFELGAMKT